MKTKYEQIVEAVNQYYPDATEQGKRNIIRHCFAYWLSRGHTIGRNNEGKLHIEGPPVALFI